MAYKNIVASIGVYERDGQKRYVNRNVGKLLETQHGPKIVLDACFNPAGCIRDEQGQTWLALFDPKPRDDNGQQSAPQGNNQGLSGQGITDDQIPY